MEIYVVKVGLCKMNKNVIEISALLLQNTELGFLLIGLISVLFV